MKEIEENRMEKFLIGLVKALVVNGVLSKRDSGTCTTGLREVDSQCQWQHLPTRMDSKNRSQLRPP